MHQIDRQCLTADTYYHVYNRAVGNELLFLTDRDYVAFFERINQFLNPFMEFYAYCLIPNHFHFFIKQDSSMV